MTKVLKDIKPLIVGLGVAGKRHLEAQLNLGIKTGVYSNNINRVDPLRKQKNVIVFDNLEKAISWANLVHVCTPDDKHTKFVALALKQKKAVLCEKSFTTSLKDALYLQRLARKYNTPLIIGNNYRLTPGFLKMKKMILENSIGALRKIQTTYLHDKNQYQGRKPLRKNEDFLYIGGSHAVDLACWIADEKVASIKAAVKHTNPKRYKIGLKFASGLSAHIKLDASSPRALNGSDLMIVGKKGKIAGHNKSDKLLYYQSSNREPKILKITNTKTYTTALEVKIVNQYLRGSLNSFWPLPNADEALSVIRILDAAAKVAASGKSIKLLKT